MGFKGGQNYIGMFSWWCVQRHILRFEGYRENHTINYIHYPYIVQKSGNTKCWQTTTNVHNSLGFWLCVYKKKIQHIVSSVFVCLFVFLSMCRSMKICFRKIHFFMAKVFFLQIYTPNFHLQLILSRIISVETVYNRQIWNPHSRNFVFHS